MLPPETKALSRLYSLARWCTLVLLLQSVLLLVWQDDFQLKTNLIVQVVTLAVFALFARKASGTYLNAPFVFAGSIFVWHSTFLLGYYFDLAPIFEFPGDTFDIGFDHIYKATSLVGLCLGLTMLGMLWGYERAKRDARATSSSAISQDQISQLGPSAGRVACYLFAGMTLILLLFIAHEGRDLFGRTYLEFYDQQGLSFIALVFYRSEYFWAFVIVLAIAAFRDNARIRAGLAVAIVGVAVVLALLGPRTGPFMCLTTLLLSWDCFVRRVRMRWIATFVVFLSAASYVIASGREKSIGAHVFQFSDTGREKLELLDLFYEQGKSIAVVIRTMEFTEYRGKLYGRTLADAALSVIPLPLLQLTGYKPAESPVEFVVNNSPDDPLYRGPGSSLIAELYYNFGMVGCGGFLIIGWYLSRAYFKYLITGDLFIGIMTATVTGTYTVMMRDDLVSSFRLLAYAAIAIVFLRRKRSASFISAETRPVRNLHHSPELG